MAGDLRTRGALASAIVLLAFMALLSFGAALRESPAFDEYAHIGAGLSYVQKFDLRMNPEHPPLSKAISGLALALSGAHADYTGPAWIYSKDFLTAFMGQWSFGEWVISRWNNSASVLFWARLPMLLLTLILGWLIFIYARRLGGTAAGLICLTVYVSAPLFLVFGPLVLTDIPIALFSLVSIWTFADLWRSPERGHILMFSLSLAGAFLTKFSAPILLLGILASALSTRWMPLSDQPKGAWRPTWKALLWTALLVYGFYFVFSWNQPTDGLARIGNSFPALVLRRILLPPATYLSGMVLVLFTFSRSTFLLGHDYPKGIWFYYPVVVALKSQLGFLGLLLLAAAAGLVRRLKPRPIPSVIPAELRMHWRTIWVTMLTFAAVSILSHFDISARHFSVPLALIMLMLAPLPGMLKGKMASGLMATLAVSCLITSARAYPWYFPYVNALGGGRPPYTLLGDSNIDWNQALPEVKQFAERHKLQDVGIDSFGFFDDANFIPKSHAWDCQAAADSDAGQLFPLLPVGEASPHWFPLLPVGEAAPHGFPLLPVREAAPHWVVVSANMILSTANCDWLTQYPQEELAGGGMYAFQLPAKIPAAGTPGGPPRPADRRSFLGMPFDMKALALQESRHPERIPDLVKEAQKSFSNAH